MATIGSLSVKIDAVVTGLEQGLATAGKRIGEFETKIAPLTEKLKVIGPLAITTGAAFAVGMAKQVADTADALGDLSERTGVAVEDLSRLQYVAKMSGSSAEQMNAALYRLSQGMAAGNPAFEAMGVSVKNADGSLRSMTDVIGDVADKFASYEDGAAKTALAMQLFGKTGAELVGVLNNGSAGIKELSEESDRLGNTLTTKTAQDAAKFNDNLDRMKTAAGGLAIELSGPVIKALADISEAFVDAQKTGTELNSITNAAKSTMTGLAVVLETIAVLGVNTAYVFTSIGREIGAAGAQLALFAQGEFKAGLNIGKMLEEDSIAARAEVDRLTAAILGLRQASGTSEVATQQTEDGKPKEGGKTSAPVVNDEAAKAREVEAEARAKELEQIREHELAKVQAFIDALKLREEARIAATMTEQEAEAERYLLEQEKLLEALELGLITKGEYQLMEQEALMNHRQIMADIDMNALNEQLAREKAAADERVRIEQQAQEMISSARLAAANSAVGLLAQLGGKNKAAAVAAIALGKALSIGQIIQNTAVAQMKAIAMLGPVAGPAAAAKIGMYGKIQAGLVAATGLAQVAGAMSGDSGGITASASSSAAGTSGGGSSGGGSSIGGMGGTAPAQGQTVNIQLQGEIFGRDQVRSLITQINEAVADGSVLRIE